MVMAPFETSAICPIVNVRYREGEMDKKITWVLTGEGAVAQEAQECFGDKIIGSY